MATETLHNGDSSEAPDYAENQELTRKNIERYVEGCEEIAVRLDTVIKEVIAIGKKPTILIPSRGAVPIFLLARRILNDLDGPENSPVSTKNANYYPNGVFEYLEDEEVTPPVDNSQVDVVLYPFTADVSTESKEEEWLAKRLRESCARTTLELLGTSTGAKDLAWYKFIMNKLVNNPNDPPEIRPENVLSSLESLPHDEDRQIILIDTVISGRASDDITSAYESLGHSVVPILAVDNTKGGKFQEKRKHLIESTVQWEMMGGNTPFVEFPLITEDNGAALLGLCAVNFSNFNKEGAFSKVNTKLSQKFIPQSCIWTLPPDFLREEYITTFREFIDTAWQIHNQEEVDIEKLKALQEKASRLTSTHDNPSQREISSYIILEEGKPTSKETASHIISVSLPRKTAESWIGEFSTSNSK